MQRSDAEAECPSVLQAICAVYGRGGYALDELEAGTECRLSRVLGDTFSLRDDDQLLLTIACRFAL